MAPAQPASAAKAILSRDLVARFSYLSLVLAAVAAFPAPVAAHARLASSEPADGGILVEAPSEVRLWFDEPISPRFSGAELLDIHAQRIDLAGIHTDPAEPKLLVLRLNKIPHGVYSVLARTLSEADGHSSVSFLVFGVGEDADLGTAAVVKPDTALPLVEAILRWLNYLALAALIGGVTVLLGVLEPARRALVNDAALAMAGAARRVRYWVVASCALATLAGVSLLLWQAFGLLGQLPEDVSLPAVLTQVVGRTRWGALWLAREGVLLALLGVLIWSIHTERSDDARIAEPRLTRWYIAALASLSLVGLQALTGHAAAVSPGRLLAVVIDAVHLLAVGVWVGGTLALAVGLFPLVRHDRAVSTAVMRAGWGRYSQFAAISVGLIFATGLYNTAHQVASLDALLTTVFGQALLAKIGLVLAMGAFGLANSMLLHPHVARPLGRLLGKAPGWTPLSVRQLPAMVGCELSLAAVALIATSLMTASPAPRGPEYTIDARRVPTELSRRVDDVVMTLLVKPNRPGQNVFTVFTASAHRPPPAEITRVLLRFEYLDENLGRSSVIASQVQPGRFLAGGSHLRLAGRWRIQVVVRRRGLEDAVGHFDWLVAPIGETPPVLISRHPLATPLTMTAAMLLATVVVLTCVGWWRHGGPPPAVLSGKQRNP